MNPSSETVSAEIQDLLDNLSDENYYFVVQELSQFLDNGTENSILLVEMCFNRFTIYGEDLKIMFVEPAIAALFRKLMEKPHFVTVFSHVVLTYTPISEEFIDDLSNSLQLSACEKIGFGLLLLDSENNDIKIAGRDFCMSRCVELCDTYDSLFSANYIVDPLRFLEKSEVLSKHVDTFMQMMLQIWLNANLSFMLAPDDPKYFSCIDFHVENLIDMDDETQAPLFAIMLGMTLISDVERAFIQRSFQKLANILLFPLFLLYISFSLR
ncbi:hypothetical protein CTI12_AA378160 [Artemisia annua]|uniref:Armadillo-like helical n=1 Tax=Artemisia annua TaxID=35608 RepID=A0A2U1MJR3_ARTAN|nr:hypothetical protein CTI12_AA378160 [Artemisia annua]